MEEYRLSSTVQRFLRYVRLNTQSDEDLKEKLKPTSPGQMDMLRMLHAELLCMGADPSWIVLNERGLLIIEVPGTPGRESEPHCSYGAHVDTYKNGPGQVEPIVHFFEGEDLVLPKSGTVIKATDIARLKGKDIITSSGDTVLGADDKAGVAGLMEALHRIFARNLPHGPFLVVFFTDEEFGDFIDPEDIPESMKTTSRLLTVDGCALGEIDDGCFSGREVKATYRHPDDLPTRKYWLGSSGNVVFKGKDAHPGDNGAAIVPSHYAACAFISLLEIDAIKSTAENLPFFCVTSINAASDQSVVTYALISPSQEFTDDSTALRLMDIAQQACELFQKTEFTINGETGCIKVNEQIELHFAIYATAALVNALVMNNEPSPWRPAEDRSFQYAYKIKGDGKECVVTCIPRAYLDTRSLQLVDELSNLAKSVTDEQSTHHGITCEVVVKHTYTSTKDAIDAHREVLDPIVAALTKNGLKAEFKQAAGGTDGAMFNLRFPEVPSPNLGTGAQRIHQTGEYICANDLTMLTNVLVDIITA